MIQTPPSKSWDKKGHITAIRPTNRSYHVEFDSGKTSVRNRKFLRPIDELPITTIPGQLGYDTDFPQIEQPGPRRSARLAKKKKSVTFGKNTVIQIPNNSQNRHRNERTLDYLTKTASNCK